LQLSVIAPRLSFTIPLPGGASLSLGSRTLVMGVLNVTPDSFSDGGVALDPVEAIDRALRMEGEGADILDVGAESTRPGAAPVAAEEEWARLRPVLKGLPHRLRIPVSIDTYKAEVARRALDAGVAIVNDISGLSYDADLGALVGSRGAALALMHMRGRSHDMYNHANYDDVVQDVSRELQRSIERAIGAGVSWDRLILDPGLGFAKRAEHSFTALAELERFAALGRPLLIGPSRKSFLAAAIGGQPARPERAGAKGTAADRDWATAAAVTSSVLAGAHIVRVHRVAEMVEVVRTADAIRQAGSTSSN
jgi:dihydropteroate synthase